MNAGTHRKQVILFFAAVLLPCLVLVALTLRLASRQKELAQKREEEDRQNVLREIREQLLSKLDVIRSRALGELAAQHPVRWSAMPDDSSIVLIAPLDGAWLRLPWYSLASGDASSAADVAPSFERQLQQGTHAELAEGSPARAGRFYHRAVQAAPYPIESAQASILLARALYKSRRHATA